MITFFLRALVSITLSVYFRRYAIKGTKNLKAKKPMILAFNHPNAFMDPVSYAIIGYPYESYYMARGDAFKPGIITYLLESLRIVPIFRIQDAGKEGLKKNQETYTRVNRLLSKNKRVIIFAEGLCIQERRLRPIKKGVPRMVFGAMEEINNPELIVVPVGVNYDRPSKFRSTVFLNIGEPIKVADYMERYNAHPARTMNLFIEDLEPKMRELITHINNPQNDLLLPQLEELYMRELCAEQKLDYKDPAQAFLVTKQLTQTVNAAEQWSPEALNDLRKKSGFYFSELNRLKIRDWLINPFLNFKASYFKVFVRALLLLAGLPLYIRGLIGNYLPYKITQRITSKKIKNIEFLASMSLGIGTFMFLFYYAIQFIIAYLLGNIGWAALVVFISALTGIFGLHYHSFMNKTSGMYRLLKK